MAHAAAADAVRPRTDWEYGLGLELDDPGFDYSLLSEFRARLAEGERADHLLQLMLDHLVMAELLKRRGRQRTGATHVLAAVRRLRRLELAGESVRAALEEIAEGDPDAPLHGQKVEIGKVPGAKAAVRERAEEFGCDGQRLLAAVWAADAPPRLRVLRQVDLLRRVWLHQYFWEREGQLRWREGTALPPASLRFDSPYDTDAHYCVKRDVEWSGYRVHFTESCDQDMPHLVVHEATTIAPVQEGQLTERIHAALATRRVTPAEHIVHTAYLSPAHRSGRRACTASRCSARSSRTTAARLGPVRWVGRVLFPAF